MMTDRTLMAVHAHPDDEVFGTGGVLAMAAAQGIRTVLVTATHGEEGEMHDPNLDPAEVEGRLGEIREEELRRACQILGISELYFLDYRDSGMAGTPENAHPENFHNADPVEAAERLVRLIRQTKPQVIVTYDERGGYGHPDHIATHHATVAAFHAAGDPQQFPEAGEPWQPQKLYYTAFSREGLIRLQDELRRRGIASAFGDEEFDPASFTVPEQVITTRVDVRDYANQQREAMLAHRTQIATTDPFLQIPDDLALEIWGTSTFIRAESLVPAPENETDLFAGIP